MLDDGWFAIWYPQMGGYSGKAVVRPLPEGCFDMWIWHAGEFPLSDGEVSSPFHLHHCDAEQFIRFGQQVQSIEKIKRLLAVK